ASSKHSVAPKVTASEKTSNITPSDSKDISESSKKRKTSAQQEVHTLDFKLEVIKWHEDKKSTQLKTARKVRINQTCLSRWLKDKATMQNQVTYNGVAVKRQQRSAYPQLEKALDNWFMEAGLLNQAQAEDARKKILEITSGYEARNIYNANKTGLLYNPVMCELFMHSRLTIVDSFLNTPWLDTKATQMLMARLSSISISWKQCTLLGLLGNLLHKAPLQTAGDTPGSYRALTIWQSTTHSWLLEVQLHKKSLTKRDNHSTSFQDIQVYPNPLASLVS
ncbi:hypothetical protein PSTT_10532, partial [Puccinia striiformis]